MALSSSLSKHRTSSRSRRFFPFSCLAAHGTWRTAAWGLAPQTLLSIALSNRSNVGAFSIHTLPNSKTQKKGGRLVRNAGFSAFTCLVSSRWFPCGVAVSMGEAGKPLRFECVQAGCHVVLRGRRGTLWHSNLFDNVSKISSLEEVSHEMLVCLRPRVSSRVSGFPVASQCLWGKLQNFSFSKVSKQVVMSFCVAGMALCDIPTCLITCGKYQNWRKSRTKCSFFCTHVSRFESLVFLWRRRVYGGSSALHTLHFTLHTLHFTLLTPHYTPHSPLYTPHSTLYTFHSTPGWRDGIAILSCCIDACDSQHIRLAWFPCLGRRCLPRATALWRSAAVAERKQFRSNRFEHWHLHLISLSIL